MTTPKKPQDYLPSKSEQLAAEAAEPPTGADMLRPPHELPSWDRIDITASLMKGMQLLGVDLDAKPDDDGKAPEFEIDTSDSESLHALATMQRSLLFAAKDQQKFTKFASGPDAISDVTNLAMWYLGALGESQGSAN